MRRLGLLLLLLGPLSAQAAVPGKADARYPFRTDFANEHLPWYRLKPGEFPPHHSEHRVGGELLEADFIHRTGQFRMDGTGALVTFTLPPFGSVMYLNAEADLRDVPLGTHLQFFLHQDATGAFTQVASMRDDYTLLASQGLTYRLDAAKLSGGTLLVTEHDPKQKRDVGQATLRVNERTRVWKADGLVKLSDLSVGDELLVNRAGSTETVPGRCTDIWVGVTTHQAATERQRKKHHAFLKARGLPARIDNVDGKKLTVTLISGDPAGLKALFDADRIVPAQWATEHRRVEAVVANEELRSYNPPVDRQGSRVLKFQAVPTDCFGCSGVSWVIEPELLLEGFRKGRIIRLFVHPTWPIKDMPYGESIYDEGFVAEKVERNPNYYPYRTDFLNKHLPWYRLKPGAFPPYYSEHCVIGELVKVDGDGRSGQFRVEQTQELVNFTLLPFGAAIYLNAEADLRDVPLGTRCRCRLYQDEKNVFTRAAVIEDEFTHLVHNRQTYRLDGARLDEGKLIVAWQIPLVRNEKDALVRPPDLGRSELAIDDKTRVWKGDQQVPRSELAVGAELLVNLGGRTATSRGRCTDVYIGPETHKLATERQRKRHFAQFKARGLPAWIDGVEGNKLIVTVFSGDREGLRRSFADEGFQPAEYAAKGRQVVVVVADEKLRGENPTVRGVKCKMQILPAGSVDCFGCSSERWQIEPPAMLESYCPGRVIRLFLDTWPIKDVP
jgi:hypothetical protein